MNEYVYLHERLFAKVDDNFIHNKSRVILFDEQQVKQQIDINNVLKLIFCHNGCWHSFLENYCANPMEPPADNNNPCGGACPYCLQKRKEYIMRVRKDGLKMFLTSTFMGTDSTDKYPSYVLKKLKQHTNVGRVMYNHPKTTAAPDARFIESTIMQLIGSGIFGMEINDTDCKARLVLKFWIEDSMPCYI